MPDIAAMAGLRVLRAGQQARLLIESGEALRVFARFDRSLYVRGGGEQLACIGGERLGDGPLNVLLHRPTVDASAFRDGDILRLDIAGAATWRPSGFAVPSNDRLRQNLAIVGAAFARVPPRGLAAAGTDDAVTERAQAGLAALAAWLTAGADGRVPDAPIAMLGLGAGLTPAGDDALGGAMIALRAFGRADAARSLASDLLAAAPTSTSIISLAHLHAAAEGEGAAALHEALAAIAAGDAEALTRALTALDRIGHSSGWDALAGAVAALGAIS